MIKIELIHTNINKKEIKLNRVIAYSTLVALLLSGCATTPTYVGTPQTNNENISMGIDHEDFQKAATEAIESMLRSGALNKKGGGRYVLTISDIINDTMQRIDIDQLIKKIRIALLQSGKVVVTTALRAGGAEDNMSYDVRKLRNHDEFNQKTVAKKGQMVAPDLSLSGKLIQRNSSVDNGSKQRVDYYFQLTLTDVNTGLAFWEGESVIGKVGSNNSSAW